MKAQSHEPQAAHWTKSPNEIESLPPVEQAAGLEEARRGFLFDLTVLALFSAFFLLRMLGA